jgi:chemotaxis protein methyltransferase CheR
MPAAVAADQAPTKAKHLPPIQDSSALDAVQALAAQTRALANQGQLQEALASCDRWIAADALDPASRYLRAVILQELGDPEQARRSLQQALYLHPDFVLAHFGLGNLARRVGKSTDAARHFANALALLEGRAPDDALPQSDGLTAGRLKEILKSLLVPEPTS